ncbi:hypothetical protein ALC57_08783 [Trachymyrmex cornetzi]|uniref:Uncharacterized protein n=1 Tax=Trachymyrmex cornetzi TaxID=471704 RepID=A0A195E1B0_9HYME|nr:hypothetical protein ALC57_08783 [Trachymyrmex cornetzi]
MNEREKDVENENTPPKKRLKSEKSRVQVTKRKFQSLWLQYPPFKGWLQEIKGENNKARCSACHCDITLSSGKHDLQCHMSTNKHKKSVMCMKETSSVKKLFDTHAENSLMASIESKQIKEAEIHISSIFALHPLAFQLIDHILPVFRQHRNVLDKITLGRKKCTNIVKNIISTVETENCFNTKSYTIFYFSVLKKLKCPIIKAYLYFLKYVLNIFNAFNALLQSSKVLISILHEESNKIIKNMSASGELVLPGMMHLWGCREKGEMLERLKELEGELGKMKVVTGEGKGEGGKESEGGKVEKGEGKEIWMERIRRLEKRSEWREREERKRNVVIKRIKGEKGEIERKIKEILVSLEREVVVEKIRMIEVGRQVRMIEVGKGYLDRGRSNVEREKDEIDDKAGISEGGGES